MTLIVTKAEVPAMSSIGYGEGETEDGRTVRFAGDHRMMRSIVEALDEGEEVEAEIDSWQVIG